jgi:hypothetical protein
MGVLLALFYYSPVVASVFLLGEVIVAIGQEKPELLAYAFFTLVYQLYWAMVIVACLFCCGCTFLCIEDCAKEKPLPPVQDGRQVALTEHASRVQRK